MFAHSFPEDMREPRRHLQQQKALTVGRLHPVLTNFDNTNFYETGEAQRGQFQQVKAPLRCRNHGEGGVLQIIRRVTRQREKKRGVNPHSVKHAHQNQLHAPRRPPIKNKENSKDPWVARVYDWHGHRAELYMHSTTWNTQLRVGNHRTTFVIKGFVSAMGCGAKNILAELGNIQKGPVRKDNHVRDIRNTTATPNKEQRV